MPKRTISRSYPTVMPQNLAAFLLEVSRVFDVTLATLHPDEMGHDRWLCVLEFSDGSEVFHYVSQKDLDSVPRYTERWIHDVHNRIIMKRSIR